MKEFLMAFDLFLNFLMQVMLIVGSVYLVEFRNWNGWWIALGIFLAMCSRPDLIGKFK